ncbi:hypothetical protein MFLAVUS_007590 [Mucor flavus]|uniref:40S ribosomal protein S6 n=1 Tax=Mucor flavus TaxID=439312 RepID=A0ABP9Z4Q9_9FUNG
MFVGDKGAGVGSGIKGFRTYGERWKENIHGEATTVCVTNGKFASQTCLYCFLKLPRPVHRVVKGDQKFDRTSKGLFWCTNPLCVSVRYKRAIKSRDALSAFAIGVVGLSTLLFGAKPPSFNNRISRTCTEDFFMKISIFFNLNIANPATGCQKLIEIEDERRLRGFYDKRMAQEVSGDSLGGEFKGYVFRISGGNDKQGFPMKQGVLLPYRVKLLMSKGHSCYRPRRTGERKRKSVRGCIVGSDLSVLSLVVVKQGEQEIPGLTDTTVPKRLGPKRASKIRKFFNLSKEDDVRKYVIRREVQPKGEGKKAYTKAPKIQRLVTPLTLQRKRHRQALKRRRAEASREAESDYKQLLAKRVKETKDKKIERRRTSSMQKSASA